jgi:hypothetical protein
MIELLFVLHQNNYDIIYIFQVVDTFLHLFSKSILNIFVMCLHESCIVLDTTFSFNQTWAPEVQYAIHCLRIQIIMQIELASDILQEPISEKCFDMMSSLVYSFA